MRRGWPRLISHFRVEPPRRVYDAGQAQFCLQILCTDALDSRNNAAVSYRSVGNYNLRGAAPIFLLKSSVAPASWVRRETYERDLIDRKFTGLELQLRTTEVEEVADTLICQRYRRQGSRRLSRQPLRWKTEWSVTRLLPVGLCD
jgi:hypothetical protein